MKHLLPVLLTGMFVSGCATLPPGDPVDYDPWEKMNRSIYGFNVAVDNASLKPIAKGYRRVLPEPVRNGISNFFRNLGAPRNVVNNFLQGKPRHGFGELARFAVNTTVGVGGLIDIAAASGLEARPEGFGQTAAVWGVPSGPYIMVPLLGPLTVRDALIIPATIRFDLLHHIDDTSVRDPLWVLQSINLRHRVLPLEDLLQESKDPYVTLRETYLQNREFEAYDGDPPLADDDELYDEFLEEEDY